MEKYVIIGNGVAGVTAAEQIRAHDADGDVTIVTDEETPFYYRIRLNEYLSGDVTEEQLIAKKDSWYADRAVTQELGVRIVRGDPARKVVTGADGREFPYGRLLIASGSHSFVPPIEGREKKGVFALRSIADARTIATWAQGIEEVVLIGGGLLGLEAGNALRKLGKSVTVVEFFPRLLPRQLDVDGAGRLQAIMEGMGFRFRLGAKTKRITGEGTVRGVELEGGETLEAGMVVVSAGVRPNMELAGSLGLECDKGIKVNGHLETGVADIYAAGDVAEFRGMPYGIWPAAMEQGRIAGTNMAGGDMEYAGTTMANTLKVVGINLASAGNIDAEDEMESRVAIRDDVYKKLVLEQGKIVGCIMLGDTKGFNDITRIMSHGTDVSGVIDGMLSDGFDFRSL